MLEMIAREPANKTKKTPLLFVHGAWHGAWCWDKYFLSYFAAKGYAAFAPSLRGHGQSPGKERLRWTSARDYVDDVASAVSQMSQPPVIIGHSMGGYIVQKYLETASLPGAVLLASAPPQGVIGTSLRMARHHPREFIKLNLQLSLYPLVETAALAQKHFFSATMPQSEVELYQRLLGDESYRAFLDMLILNLPKPKRVRTPVLVLGGSQDTIFTVSEVEATGQAYNTDPIFFPMAHDMMLEDGWEEVAEGIIQWLDVLGVD